MRIVHLADTHLGYRNLYRVNRSGRNEREQDVYDAFDAAISKAIELKPDAVLHAGDLFDSNHPSSAALRVALDGFRRLREAGIPTVVIAGNHSTPRLTATEHVFAVLERFEGVHVVYAEPRSVRIGALCVHAVPHNNETDKLVDVLRGIRADASAEQNVLLAHLGLDGLTGLVGAETGAVTVSGEALTNAKDFDYIALGHLHQFQPVGRNIAYAGSLERFSWADDAVAKGIVEVDLDCAPGTANYARLHAITTRPHLVLEAVDASAEHDLTAAITSRAEGVELDGAMVQITIRNVTPSDWAGVDRHAIDRVYARCLHFECVREQIGAAPSVATSPALSEFLAGWAATNAKDLDLGVFVERAESFLALADEELAV